MQNPGSPQHLVISSHSAIGIYSAALPGEGEHPIPPPMRYTVWTLIGLSLQDVRSLRSLGIHCCTFCLTFEPLDEPVRLLRDAAKAAGLQQNEFVVMQHGGLLATAKGRDAAVPPVLWHHAVFQFGIPSPRTRRVGSAPEWRPRCIESHSQFTFQFRIMTFYKCTVLPSCTITLVWHSKLPTPSIYTYLNLNLIWYLFLLHKNPSLPLIGSWAGIPKQGPRQAILIFACPWEFLYIIDYSFLVSPW